MSEELKNLYKSGKYQEVLDQFARKESQGEWAVLPEEEQIECIYYKCRSLEWLGRYEEALQTATMARTTYPSPTNPCYLLALLAAQYYVSCQLGVERLDEAKLVVVEGEAIIGALTDKERQTGALWIAVFEHVKGLDYFDKKKLNSALEYYRKALKSFEALDNRYGIALCLHWIGFTYYWKSDNETALDYLQRSLTLYESLGNKQGIGNCLDSIGHVYSFKRELNTALEYYQRELSIAKASNSPLILYYALTHSGMIYAAKDDPDKALDYFQQSLAIVEPLNLDWTIAYTFNLIGMAYHQKCELDIAIPFFQRSLAIREAQKDDNYVVRSLFHLVLLSLDQQEVEQAQKYLTSLQKVAARIPDELKVAHLRSRLAEALVLKQSPRMTQKSRAQTLLTEIVKEKGLYTLIAMVALCDLLLFELKATGDSEVWEDARALIHQFHTKAQGEQAFSMVVNALLLRAKFATIDGELDQAQEYFNEAWMIVKEKKLNALVKKVETEQKEFEADFQKWQGLIQRHTSLKDRLVHAQLEEYIQAAQKEVNRISLTGEV